jgi:filamentous hemagglutinin
LAAANIAMAVDQAAEAIKKNPDQIGGVNLSISLGSSKAQSQTTSTSDTSAPSHVTAANNVTVTALSDDITVQGSQLNAGNTITLQAEKALKLQAAQDSAEQHSTNRNQSASIGVGFALGAQQSGINLNVAASQGRGNADGSDRAWVNTDLTAGQKIKTESGTDTTIRGGVLTAPQVTVTTGASGNGNGNLTIESLQDTSQYKSQQQQQGATLSIPITGAGRVSGSISTNKSNIDSDYASVHQQSGIRAGDGGFQVNVNGNTTLTGGAITSTQVAVDQQKNTFHTEGTLTATDINNKADYQAKSVAVNIGAGFSPSGQLAPQGTGVGLGKDGDSQSSITQAAITDIAGDTQAHTGDGKPSLVNRFDAERVQKEITAQVQITQLFGQQAGSRLSEYAQQQRTVLRDALKAATAEAERQTIQEKIHDLNMQERALNVLVGGVTGFGGVVLLKESLSTAADQMRELMIEDSMKFKGVTDGKTVLSNVSGVSEGVRGDGVKVGGTRVDLDLLCGPINERCRTNADGSLMIDPNGYIFFNEGKFEEFMKTAEGKKMIGPTGGVQGVKGKLFGIDYEAGSWQDRLIEAFSGTHDLIGGKLSGLYDDQGNIRRKMNELERNIYDKGITTTAIVPSVPFAAAELLSPELWKAMSIFLKEAR